MNKLMADIFCSFIKNKEKRQAVHEIICHKENRGTKASASFPATTASPHSKASVRGEFPVLASTSICTGCGACFNICPKHAIQMVADEEGFLAPVIDATVCIRCKLCEQQCPVLHPAYSNQSPDCFAMMASDEERMKSSSGAFVPLVAKWILNQNGIVFGAVWNKDFSVSHVGVEHLEDLGRIRGSKYVQSNVGLTYAEVKKELKKGRWVLYTGTPCQIAGLYSCLGKTPTEKLISIDVVCHGAPSCKVFKKYLDDQFGTANLVEYQCRNKSAYGWSVSAHAVLIDGREINETADKNIFMRGFNPCMIMRRACSTCPFSRLPRQGDFSCGDFWGVERYNASMNDKKGTSFVLLNNEKSKQFIKHIKNECKIWEQVPLDAITRINKTVIHPFKSHPGRKHFYSSLNIKPFKKLVEDSLSHHYDFGIVGLWYGINYGSVLTYYALYSLLRDLGYDPVMLPRPNNLWSNVASRFDDPNSIAQRFIWKHCNVFVNCKEPEEYQNFNDLCDSFILGSDVVWNYNVCGRDTDQFFFLDWVESGHKKIAYASSFGNGLSGPQPHQEKAKYYINQMDAVSVRESSGVELARLQTGRTNVAHVLDPVFMCNPTIYEKVMTKGKHDASHVFAYLLNRDKHEIKEYIIDKACELLNEHNPIICANPNNISAIKSIYKNVTDDVLSIEEWLYYIKHAKFYIGDSYHGLCFALIFHIPFILLYRSDGNKSTEARFISLLKIVGLEHRLLMTEEEFKNIDSLFFEEINWNDVDARLQKMKDFSMDWLKKAIALPPRPLSPEKLIQEAELRKKNNVILQIKNDIKNLNKQLSEK